MIVSGLTGGVCHNVRIRRRVSRRLVGPLFDMNRLRSVGRFVYGAHVLVGVSRLRVCQFGRGSIRVVRSCVRLCGVRFRRVISGR